MSALILFFFFSSRRRHTRFDCDWSSDVCSSDLARHRPRRVVRSWGSECASATWPCEPSPQDSLDELVATSGIRSEEHTSELQSQSNLVCRLLLEKKKKPAVLLD